MELQGHSLENKQLELSVDPISAALILETMVHYLMILLIPFFNPGPAEPGYALPLQKM